MCRIILLNHWRDMALFCFRRSKIKEGKTVWYSCKSYKRQEFSLVINYDNAFLRKVVENVSIPTPGPNEEGYYCLTVKLLPWATPSTTHLCPAHALLSSLGTVDELALVSNHAALAIRIICPLTLKKVFKYFRHLIFLWYFPLQKFLILSYSGL